MAPSFTIRSDEMTRGTATIGIALVVIGLVAVVSLAFLHDGLSARATPGRLEEYLARHAWYLSIPSGARAEKNPVPNTTDNLADARLHFADHCSICHGNDGSGDGLFGRGLYPKPPDLRQAATQNRSDGELFWIIENGVRFTGMPAFAGHGMDEDSWKLVLFIRHLPQLTPAERLEMSRNNPKSPTELQEDREEDEFLSGPSPQHNATPAGKTAPRYPKP
jgi:mono/diheme cytochrome c family protein